MSTSKIYTATCPCETCGGLEYYKTSNACVVCRYREIQEGVARHRAENPYRYVPGETLKMKEQRLMAGVRYDLN